MSKILPGFARPLVLFILAFATLPAAEAQGPYKIGFEDGEDRPYTLREGERKETAPLSGKASLVYEGEKGWSEFFTTDPAKVVLESKATWRVKFRYRVGRPWEKDGGLYVLFRVPSEGRKADVGFTMKKPENGTEGEFSKTVTLGESKGYVLIIGCHKNASIAIDDLVLEKVTAMDRPATPLSKYIQVWSDEFEGKGPPAASNWNILRGFRTKAEEQYYTTNLANLRQEGGNLVMEARVESVSNQFHTPGRTDWRGNERTSAEYTSGYVDSSKKFTFTFGRIEARAKIPEGSGLWPAIWTLGEWSNGGKAVGWPSCGEIDVMEYIGVEPETIHATTHFQKGGAHESVGQKLSIPKPWEDYHKFIAEWDPQGIHFYVDDKYIHSFTVEQALEKGLQPFHQPHFVILNLALGGWGGTVDRTKLPAKFLVDYVRVYRMK